MPNEALRRDGTPYCVRRIPKTQVARADGPIIHWLIILTAMLGVFAAWWGCRRRRTRTSPYRRPRTRRRRTAIGLVVVGAVVAVVLWILVSPVWAMIDFAAALVQVGVTLLM